MIDQHRSVRFGLSALEERVKGAEGLIYPAARAKENTKREGGDLA